MLEDRKWGVVSYRAEREFLAQGNSNSTSRVIDNTVKGSGWGNVMVRGSGELNQCRQGGAIRGACDRGEDEHEGRLIWWR